MKRKTNTVNKKTSIVLTQNNGITLISLIITIIILLILATVAISIAINSDGLFARARKAAEDWNTSVINEEKAAENVFKILNEVNVGGVIGGGEMQPPTVEVQSITLNPTSLSLKEGETAQVTATINPPNATNQNIEWSSESDTIATVSKTGDGKTATVTAGKAGTTNIVATVDGQSATSSVEVKPKGANGPVVLGEAKFQYVTWTDTNNDGTYEEVLTDKENGAPDGWYNYEEKKWANIKTTSTTPNEDGTYNEAYWVWIPRYAYQVPAKPTLPENNGNPPEFKIAFLQGNTDTPVNTSDLGGATIRPASEIKDTGPSVGDWVVHPAFTFGDQELSGIWVAKFEASSSKPDEKDSKKNITGGGNNTDLYINVKPNVTSWRYIDVSNIFTVCQAMNKTNGALEGAVSADPHMMKNVEWGAVVYLSQSKYGKKEQVWNNPSQNFITGQAGTEPDAYNITNTNNYNTKYGQEASTTGNVYGVYDMAGCADEYVAACIKYEYNKALNMYAYNLVNADEKYKDLYVRGNDSDIYSYNYLANKNKYGDAVYETSYQGGGMNGSSWQQDYSTFPYVDWPVFTRGGANYHPIAPGLFNFNNGTGIEVISISFRPVFVTE